MKNLFKSLSSSGTPRLVKDSSSFQTTSLTSVREVSGKKTGVSPANTKPLGEIGGGEDGKFDLSTGSRGLASKKGVSKVSYNIPSADISGGIDGETFEQDIARIDSPISTLLSERIGSKQGDGGNG